MDRQEPKLLQCWLAEALGIGIFVAFSQGAGALAQRGVLPDAGAVALVPGLVILALIFGLSDLSGAHFNPAITLAFALRGSFPWKKVPVYLTAQMLGALAGVWLIYTLLPLPKAHEQVSPWGAFWLEAGCTAVLTLVILATAKRKADVQSQAGLVIAGTLALCLYTAGSVTTLGVNPALALAVVLFGTAKLLVWPHLLGPLIGSSLAAVLTFLLRGTFNREEKETANGQTETE